ncbi:MAG: DUF885 domain-containing protein [Lachnospiraceae bacterium]|nr:DUF885 domain-containing protein [Lachnospiraceae bacterium]
MHSYTSLKTRLLCFLLIISLLSATVTACQSGQGTDLPDKDIVTAPVNTETDAPETPTDTQAPDTQESTAAPDESQAPDPNDPAVIQAEQERFSAYTYDLFLETVLDNTINLHYTIADPESYGITEYPITLGSFEEWTEEDILNDLDEMAVELATYNYDQLTEEQQMTYDILMHHIETERSASSLSLYYEPLGPVTGAATQLPITFAEYKFYREQDIKDYLQLLPMLQGYFESIIAFEQRKADAGLFMTESTLDANLEICSDFMANPDNNFLITSFASRMEKIDWLDEQAKADYIAQNKTIVLDSVFSAFTYLSTSLEAMRGHCTEEGGLTRLPEGKEYFTYLMETQIGSGRTPEEMLQLIQTYQQKQLIQMATLINAAPELATLANTFSFSMTDPAQILEHLKAQIAEDYPGIPDTSYTINYVEKELEDVLSPAFYMIPPLDRYLENTIYINNGSLDESTLFSTLAHEGYPGHLFQNVYFNSKNTEPLRSMLSYLGYSEGWATYVEIEAYAYDPEVRQDLLEVMALNNSIMLSIYAASDICINYMDWDATDTLSYFQQFFGNALTLEDITPVFEAISGDPCNYLSYHGGYLEILEMRAIAEATLDKNFDLKEFHTFVLDLGECPFSLANQRLADWLEAKE